MIDAEPSFRLRVLTGPLKDCVYPSEDRLEIGRSETADIQLAGRGVSRQHASVVASEEGCVLLDMLSTNGTWMDGDRVTRRVLAHGDRFVIDDCEFEFEMLHPSAPPSEVPDKPRISRARLSRETVDFQGPRLPSAAGRPKPAATPGPRPSPAPEFHKHEFLDGSGHPYPGNLLADVMLYRNLRLRVVQRGDKVKPENLEAFKSLDERLRSPEKSRGDSDRREFTRYTCQLPGTIRLEQDDEVRLDILMLDFAVDGARVKGDKLPAEAKGMIWLSLPNIGADGLRSMVFTCRAAWSKPGELGLVFSGAPSWATRNRDRLDDTTPTPLAPLRLKKKSG